MTQHTIVTTVHDRPGVLNRAVNLFRRRGLNIESLTVTRTEREGVSRITWVFETDDVTPVVRQLEKLIDVLDVSLDGRAHQPPDELQRTLHSPDTPPPSSRHTGSTVVVPPRSLPQADGAA